MSADENKRVVSALVDALNARAWRRFFELVDEACEWTVVPSGITWRGPQQLVVELREGKIIRYRDNFDRLTLFEQLGLGTLAWHVEPSRR